MSILYQGKKVTPNIVNCQETDFSKVTARPEFVMKGKKFHDEAGQLREGTAELITVEGGEYVTSDGILVIEGDTEKGVVITGKEDFENFDQMADGKVYFLDGCIEAGFENCPARSYVYVESGETLSGFYISANVWSFCQGAAGAPITQFAEMIGAQKKHCCLYVRTYSEYNGAWGEWREIG